MRRGNPRRGIPRRETLAKSETNRRQSSHFYYICTNPSCTQQNKTRARRLILRRGITQGKNKIVIIHSRTHHLNNTHARAIKKVWVANINALRCLQENLRHTTAKPTLRVITRTVVLPPSRRRRPPTLYPLLLSQNSRFLFVFFMHPGIFLAKRVSLRHAFNVILPLCRLGARR